MRAVVVGLVGLLLGAGTGFALGSGKAAFGMSPEQVIAVEGVDFQERLCSTESETESLVYLRLFLGLPARQKYFFLNERLNRYTYSIDQDVTELLAEELSRKYGPPRSRLRVEGAPPLYYWWKGPILIGLTRMRQSTLILYSCLSDFGQIKEDSTRTGNPTSP